MKLGKKSSKRYLSGFDYLMGLLDSVLKHTTCAGNMFQIVFELDSRIKEDIFRERLKQFIGHFPIINGRICRDYNLIPYWKIPRVNESVLNFNVHYLETSSTEEEVMSLMEECINKPFINKNDHIAFHIVYTKKQQSYLLIRFDHRLFDGGGGELFINLLQKYLTQGDNANIAEGIDFAVLPDNLNWRHKLLAGKKVKQQVVAISDIPIIKLPIHNSVEKRGFRFKKILFDQMETNRIYDEACRESGYLMDMPYFLAVTLQVLHLFFKNKNISASDYLVPVSIDNRKKQGEKQEIFFNYASMLFFNINVDMINDRKLLIETIKEQMYEQIKSDLPNNIWRASSLLRIIPLPVLEKICYPSSKENIGSFCFSYLGKSLYQSPDLMDTKIKNIFHMPRVPVPPGLGIFFSSFAGQLSLVLTWLDGLLSDEEVGLLENNFKKTLQCRETNQ